MRIGRKTLQGSIPSSGLFGKVAHQKSKCPLVCERQLLQRLQELRKSRQSWGCPKQKMWRYKKYLEKCRKWLLGLGPNSGWPERKLPDRNLKILAYQKITSQKLDLKKGLVYPPKQSTQVLEEGANTSVSKRRLIPEYLHRTKWWSSTSQQKEISYWRSAHRTWRIWQ